MRGTSGTIDPEEIRRFAAQAETWWDPEGSFRTLHRINPARLGFIRQHLTTHFRSDPLSLRPFDGLTALDIGCGGGLAAEPMARLGFTVTGIDAGAEAIDVARTHAEATGLSIDYRVADAESIAEADKRFDAVLALEVIEHVADPDDFFTAVSTLVRSGGAFIGATLNRTPKSFALAILGAEYIFRWLPPGTHDWNRFVRPNELQAYLKAAGLTVSGIQGVVFDPLRWEWRLSSDADVNYMAVAEKRMAR